MLRGSFRLHPNGVPFPGLRDCHVSGVAWLLTHHFKNVKTEAARSVEPAITFRDLLLRMTPGRIVHAPSWILPQCSNWNMIRSGSSEVQ